MPPEIPSNVKDEPTKPNSFGLDSLDFQKGDHQNKLKLVSNLSDIKKDPETNAKLYTVSIKQSPTN